MAKTKSIQAQASAAIRRDLKAAYPGVSFSVRAECFAGGDAVDISWNDGPTTDEVEHLTRKYLVTAYLYDAHCENVPQVSYVQTYRCLSRAAYVDLVHDLNALFGWSLEVDDSVMHNAITSASDGFDPTGCQKSEYVWRQFRKTSYVHGDTPVVMQEAR